ncbi:hypothetical protein [Pseudovibrio sp. Tun.PSC04-5.I4]|uniref:hypothetical protein n=1 Tax=Pseudovibrio sp. Tun.PSC04-5.I4 TaxID=1798213 RepID=UPI00088ABF4A|nr:hypothetical protein [Pseudovibrio sp. Tun.PSC04-5.I4]SDR06957.1 hypothetical protein SAMN04515695_2595 [Pseudovibrio sp. Tun.PSC04-5.I4]
MPLLTLRHSSLAIALTFGLSLPADSQLIHGDTLPNPFADAKRLFSTRKITIQNLTVLNDTTNISFCKARYGSEYNIFPAPNGLKGYFVSDKGHRFFLYTRSELRGEGIYAEHSRVLINFPNKPDEEVEVTQFVAGFTDSKIFSGVFSDGTCSGRFSVVAAR